MCWRYRLVFLFLIFFINYKSHSSDLAFSRNARTFETQQSGLITKGMAHACLSIFQIPDGLPCNPAMVPLAKKSSLGAEVLISNGYSNLENIQKLLGNKVNQDLIDTVFTQGRIIQIEANTEINFISKYLNGRYTPITLKGFSVVRNEANPDVEIYAVEEKSMNFQSGVRVYKGLLAGLQTRFVGRKFIRQRFKLLELATPAGRDLIKPKEQFASYFEPGATWIISRTWQPRVSLFVANLGVKSQDYEELPTPVELQGGIGISPPIKWGRLDLTLEYRSMNYEEGALEKFRGGALYHFGSMYLSGGVDSNGLSGGVFYGLDQINAGVMYSTTRFINEDEEFFTETVYVQLGWQI